MNLQTTGYATYRAYLQDAHPLSGSQAVVLFSQLHCLLHDIPHVPVGQSKMSIYAGLI